MQVLNKSLLACILAVVSTFFCLTAHSADLPKPTGFINDFAGVIEPAASQKLAQIADSFQKATGNELAVVTVKSLEGEPIENYAVTLFKDWGIGKKGEDNGLLLLVAPNDREARIEVGYGLEPYINDALAGRVIRDTMIPHFKDGDYSAGIFNGTLELINVISKRSGVSFDPYKQAGVERSDYYQVQTKKSSALTKFFQVLFWVILILLFIKNPWAFLFFSGMSGGGGGSFKGFGGGGGGGGFGGFGGGSSGGGGASGRW